MRCPALASTWRSRGAAAEEELAQGLCGLHPPGCTSRPSHLAGRLKRVVGKYSITEMQMNSRASAITASTVSRSRVRP